MSKPAFCIVNCQPVMVISEDLDAGGSCFCLGINNEPEKWAAKTTEHDNDLHFCIYTPFKGWTKFAMYDGDLEIISQMIARFKAKTGRKFRLGQDEEATGPDAAIEYLRRLAELYRTELSSEWGWATIAEALDEAADKIAAGVRG